MQCVPSWEWSKINVWNAGFLGIVWCNAVLVCQGFMHILNWKWNGIVRCGIGLGCCCGNCWASCSVFPYAVLENIDVYYILEYSDIEVSPPKYLIYRYTQYWQIRADKVGLTAGIHMLYYREQSWILAWDAAMVTEELHALNSNLVVWNMLEYVAVVW